MARPAAGIDDAGPRLNAGAALEEITAFLDHVFAADLYDEETTGVYRPAARPVRRLGLALEPWPGLAEWVRREELDALFLHRHWALGPGEIPDGIGVIAYHLPFDERLTTGFNPRLAVALGISAAEPFGEKEGRTIGMVGWVPRQTFGDLARSVAQIFGGYEEIHGVTRTEVTRVVVAGAMTDRLVREAVEFGAEAYITGQFRHPARPAAEETGIAVIATGHRRTEEWGLRALAGVIGERWAGIRTVLPDGG